MGISSHQSLAALVAGLLLLAGCRGPEVRAVIGLRAPDHGDQLTAHLEAKAFSTAEFNGATDGSFRAPSSALVPRLAPLKRLALPPSIEVEARPVAVFGRAIDLGWPLEVDLGAGEFPHDDEMHPLEGTHVGRGGFSSSVVRFTWREPLRGAVGLHGTAAVTRVQEDPLFESLGRGSPSWVAVGFHASF
ncbi:MAG: hypothetical protein P8M11_06640 [Planctomycetota bacterium]|nr:hypothetical protein [Planctomycetota bacterium]MDG1984223.1 hypothetical protein [Planctomycetota bacterium]